MELSRYTIVIPLVVAFVATPFVVDGANLADRLSGKILLQVEEHGEGHLFPARWGRVGFVTNLHTQGWADIVKAAKLEDFTPHDLRRTAATWAAKAGAPVEHIAKWLGHAPPGGITGSVYALVDLDQARTAAQLAARAMLEVVEES